MGSHARRLTTSTNGATNPGTEERCGGRLRPSGSDHRIRLSMRQL